MSEEESLRKLIEMVKSGEPLLPELKRFLVTVEKGVQQINHPFVQAFIYIPAINSIYNKQYRDKREALQSAVVDCDWGRYVFLHERAYRLQAFHTAQHQMSDADYWSILGRVWTDSENLHQYGDMLPSLIQSERPGRENMMRSWEKAVFDTLPDELVVYRGHHGRNRMGWSWTLSQWQARWFSMITDRKARGVVRGKVKKTDVVALMLRRKEFEVIVNPEDVSNPRRFDPDNWVYTVYADLGKEGAKGLVVSAIDSYHGMWHWRKVDWNVQQLCKAVPEANLEVCRAFAYLHDCKREHEKEDPVHGEKAAEYVEQIKDRLGFTEPQLELLKAACRDHEKGTISDNPTIGVCWDADRLDIMRVGTKIDPKYLSTQAAKDMVWRV